MHKIQKTILKKLWKKKRLKYSELACDYYPFENVYYHIDHLVSNDYIEKVNGMYELTSKGAREIPKFSSKSFNDIEYKIPLVVLICEFNDKFLLRVYHEKDVDRLTFYGLPSFKAISGFNIEEQIVKYIHNKFQMEGKAQYLCTQQYLEYSKTKELLFDDILICFHIKSTSMGKVNNDYVWLDKSEIRELNNLHSSVQDFILSDIKPFSIRTVFEDYIL